MCNRKTVQTHWRRHCDATGFFVTRRPATERSGPKFGLVLAFVSADLAFRISLKSAKPVAKWSIPAGVHLRPCPTGWVRLAAVYNYN